jgi:putative colanic acid biosynthesis UDP-glucose lipid carrier transferase
MSHNLSSSDWLRRAMRCFDAGIALLVSFALMGWLPGLDHTDSLEYPLLILAGSMLLPACGELLGLYQPWRGRSLYTMLGVYALSWLGALVLISLLLIATQSTQTFSRLWMGTSALSVLLIGSLLRAILYRYLRYLRATGRNLKRVLLIGPAPNIAQLERRLAEMPYIGYVVSARHVDDDNDETCRAIQALARKSVFKRDFDEVWLSYPLAEGEKVRRLAGELVSVPASVRYFPDLSDVRLLNHRMTQLAGMYSLDLNYSPLDGPRRIIKAIEDRVLGLLMFVIFLPVMLVVACLIRREMGSPVLFKQYRHGIDGKRFRIYKFRTMSLHQADETWQARFGDPRITPFGAFLRRTSLDELPQLYNVLQGRMSLVGPRPHAMDHNEYYKEEIEAYMQRHRVKPGMTGWAQVHGYRGNTDTLNDMKKRVEYDLYYIDHWSLGLDLKILAMTVTRGFVNRQP